MPSFLSTRSRHGRFLRLQIAKNEQSCDIGWRLLAFIQRARIENADEDVSSSDDDDEEEDEEKEENNDDDDDKKKKKKKKKKKSWVKRAKRKLGVV